REGFAIMSVGLYVGRLSNSITLSGVKVEDHVTGILLDLTARRAWNTGLYLGYRIGMGLINANVSTSNTSIDGSSTTLTTGPAVGYEFPFANVENLSLSFD